MRLVFLFAFGALASFAAPAQYSTEFEVPTFAGSASGAALAGQDGFQLASSGDADARCYTYAGNTLGVASHPADGGAQFVAVTRATNAMARSQRDVAFADAERCWTVNVDINLLFVGNLPANNYAASLSLQPYPDAGSIVVLFHWDDAATADAYTVRVLGFGADGGTPFLAGLPVPPPAFHGLTANHWYRLSLRFEFGRNALSAIGIRDLHSTADGVGFVPVDLHGYYLGGGAASNVRPTALRIFGGGGVPSDSIAGNTLAIDNLEIGPSGATPCFTDVDFNNRVNLTDLAEVLSNFGTTSGATYADGDFDCDADVDLDDLAQLLRVFGLVCN